MTDPCGITILMADDDADDCFITRQAFAQASVRNDLRFVANGEELLAYLRREPPYDAAPRPGLILLDLNMPRMNGKEALNIIKNDPQLAMIPVVALTNSSAERDVTDSYRLGVNAYITKPVTFDRLVEAVRSLTHYWLDTVTLPLGAHG